MPQKNQPEFKKRGSEGVYDLYIISVIFLIMLMLSSAFLLYQWKDYKIVEYSKEIQDLRSDVLKLQSAESRYRARINSDLIKYHRIAEVAKDKLQLLPSVEEPVILTVDKRLLDAYVQKDNENKNEN
ncbi:MAG: hypothetical protein R3C26_10210 [Calditrichia bacterium]